MFEHTYLLIVFTLNMLLSQLSVPPRYAGLTAPTHTHIIVFLTLGLCPICFLPFHVKQPCFLCTQKGKDHKGETGETDRGPMRST